MSDYEKAQLLGALLTAIGILVPVLTAIAGVYAVKLMRKAEQKLQTSLSKEQFDMLVAAAHQAVLYAEQLGLTKEAVTGAAKKLLALDRLDQWAAEHGVETEMDTLEALIESAVFDEFNRDRALYSRITEAQRQMPMIVHNGAALLDLSASPGHDDHPPHGE